MAKQTRQGNIRVEVFPACFWDPWRYPDNFREAALSTAATIVEQIKRHIDDVEDVSVVYETEHYCTFCDSVWEVFEEGDADGNPVGMPVCCNKAMVEWEDAKKLLDLEPEKE